MANNLTNEEIRLAMKVGSVEVPMCQNYMLFYDQNPSEMDSNLYLKIHAMYYLLNEYGVGRYTFKDWNYATYQDSSRAPYHELIQCYIDRMNHKLKSCSDEEIEAIRKFGELEEQPNKRIIIEARKAIRDFSQYHRMDTPTVIRDITNILSLRSMMDHPRSNELYDVLVSNNFLEEGQYTYYQELIQFIRGGLHLSIHQKYELQSAQLDRAREYMIDLNINKGEEKPKEISNITSFNTKEKKKRVKKRRFNVKK